MSDTQPTAATDALQPARGCAVDPLCGHAGLHILTMTRATRRASISALAVVTLGLLLLFGCCSTGRHYEVTRDEFVRLARLPTGSALDSRFIGATEQRAYLAVWSAMPSSAGGGSHVYSVALDDLPPEIAQRIRSGGNPWPK